MARPKAIQLWNGRGFGEWNLGRIYIAATTKKAAVAFLVRLGFGHGAEHELKHYYCRAWGQNMDGVIPEPGVWGIVNMLGDTPKRIL